MSLLAPSRTTSMRFRMSVTQAQTLMTMLAGHPHPTRATALDTTSLWLLCLSSTHPCVILQQNCISGLLQSVNLASSDHVLAPIDAELKNDQSNSYSHATNLNFEMAPLISLIASTSAYAQPGGNRVTTVLHFEHTAACTSNGTLLRHALC